MMGGSTRPDPGQIRHHHVTEEERRSAAAAVASNAIDANDCRELLQAIGLLDAGFAWRKSRTSKAPSPKNTSTTSTPRSDSFAKPSRPSPSPTH